MTENKQTASPASEKFALVKEAESIVERFSLFYDDSGEKDPRPEAIRRILNSLMADKMDNEAKMFRVAEHLRMVPAELRADAKKRLEALFA